MKSGRSPSWDALYEAAAIQQGCFTREQALDAGFSDQLLYKHVTAGNVERIHRGIYRIARFPESAREQEDLVLVWLWSQSAGVFSHETALALHGLSDALPSKIHITLPTTWRARHPERPPGVRVSFADLPPADRTFVGAVPVTMPARTINDVATANGDAAVVEAAVRQALHRGLAAPGELLPAVEVLAALRADAWPVRPDAQADLHGSWLTEFISGTCASPPPIDWRADAADLAAQSGGRLRGAHYSPRSRTMTIELAWPISAREQKPSAHDLQSTAAARFGWAS